MKKVFVIAALIALLFATAASSFDVFYGQPNGEVNVTGNGGIGYRSENGVHGMWHYGVFYSNVDNVGGVTVIRYLLGSVVATDYFNAGGGFSEPVAFDSMYRIVTVADEDSFTWRGHRYN